MNQMYITKNKEHIEKTSPTKINTFSKFQDDYSIYMYLTHSIEHFLLPSIVWCVHVVPLEMLCMYVYITQA